MFCLAGIEPVCREASRGGGIAFGVRTLLAPEEERFADLRVLGICFCLTQVIARFWLVARERSLSLTSHGWRLGGCVGVARCKRTIHCAFQCSQCQCADAPAWAFMFLPPELTSVQAHPPIGLPQFHASFAMGPSGSRATRLNSRVFRSVPPAARASGAVAMFRGGGCVTGGVDRCRFFNPRRCF